MAKEVKEFKEVNTTIPADQETDNTSGEQKGEDEMKKEFFPIRAAKWAYGKVAGAIKKHPVATRTVGFTLLTLGTVMFYDAVRDAKRENYPMMPLDKNDPIDTTFTPVPEATADPIQPIETSDIFDTATSQVFDSGMEVTNF